MEWQGKPCRNRHSGVRCQLRTLRQMFMQEPSVSSEGCLQKPMEDKVEANVKQARKGNFAGVVYAICFIKFEKASHALHSKKSAAVA